MGWDDAATRFPADSEYVRSAELVIAIRPTASLGGRASADLPSCDSGARRRSEIKIDGRRTITRNPESDIHYEARTRVCILVLSTRVLCIVCILCIRRS
jgi:hypothetical protein